MVLTDDVLIQAGAGLHDRFGTERADRFGQALPGLVTELAELWGVRVDALLDCGATSVVLAVSGDSATPAVLKVSPDEAFLARQVEMLRHLEPTKRVPAVLESGAGAVLLERVVPGDPIDDARASPPTAHEWGALLRDLHSTTPDGVTDRLDDRCADMFERIGARQAAPQVRAEVPDAVWEEAVTLCRDLLRTGTDQAVIHGDLHLGNVLACDRRGLVAIDPKLCVGDRCFDMVDFVAVQGGPAQMADRATQLADVAEMDLDRLLAWSKVNAVVTAISLITWFGPDQRSADLLAFAERV